MGNLFIRDVEDELIQRLKRTAKANRTSLQHEAKNALRKGAPVTGADRRRVFEEIRNELGGFPKVRTSGADIVREVREEEG